MFGVWALTLEAFSLSENFLNVPSHDLMHLGDVFAELAKVALCPRVQVELPSLLDKGVCREKVP